MDKKIVLWKFIKKKENIIKEIINNFMVNYESENLIILDWLIYNNNEGIMIIKSNIDNLKEYLLKYFDDIKINKYEKINDWLK